MKAYDSHCNLVLGEVEETIYQIEEDEDGEESIKVRNSCPLERLKAENVYRQLRSNQRCCSSGVGTSTLKLRLQLTTRVR